MSEQIAEREAAEPWITDAQERDAIVRYLSIRKLWTRKDGFTTPQDLAAEIQRGEHRKDEHD